jgi:hypothetical protein
VKVPIPSYNSYSELQFTESIPLQTVGQGPKYVLSMIEQTLRAVEYRDTKTDTFLKSKIKIEMLRFHDFELPKTSSESSYCPFRKPFENSRSDKGYLLQNAT